MPAIFLFHGTLMMFGLAVGVFWRRESQAVTFLIMLMGLGTVFLMRPTTVLIIQAIQVAVFCASSILLKSYDNAMYDVVNVLQALFFSMLISWHMNHVRMEDILVKNQMEENEQVLRTQSITDELTGLHNRRFFFQTLIESISLVVSEEKSLCIAIFDVDFFKIIMTFMAIPKGIRCFTQ